MRVKKQKLKHFGALLVCASALLVLFNNCGEFKAVESLTTGLDSRLNNERLAEDVKPPNANISLQCDQRVLRGSANSSLRKLTKLELLSAIKDLAFNHSAFAVLVPDRDMTYVALENQDPLQLAINSYPGEYAKIPGEDFEKLHGREQVQSWMDVSEAYADKFISSSVIKNYQSEPCRSAKALTTTCLSEFIIKFGRKAYRRPLSASEVSSYESMVNELEPEVSTRQIVARILRSTDFIFQLEAGIRDDGRRVRLSDYEVASRISFATIGSIPDEALASAADAGALKTLAQVSAHTDRLLASPRGQAKMREFFADWLRLNEVTQPNTMWANFAMLLDFRNETSVIYSSNRMETSYREEAQDFLHGVIWERKGSFRDLMTAPIAYPRDVRTAKVYGVALSEADSSNYKLVLDGTARPAPNNPGLLTRAALLSSSASSPNAIMRGVNIKRRILCDNIPTPDFSVVADRVSDLEQLDPTHSHYPNHQLITKLTSSTSCVGCHSQINPMGYLFEAYNPLGQKNRTQLIIANSYEFSTRYADHGIREPANLPAGVSAALLVDYPLPGPQSGLYIDSGLPTVFANSDDLIDAISESRKARACMQVRLFRHFHRRSETLNDACALAEATEILKKDEPILNAMIRTIANEDIFWGKSK